MRIMWVILGIFLLSSLAVAPVIAGNSPSWFKSFLVTKTTITGHVVQEEIRCDNYTIVTPTTAVANSVLSQSYDAGRAIDGNTNSFWLGNNNTGYPKWIYFDLGSRKCISAVDLYIQTFYAPLSFNIEVSDDAGNWTTVLANNIMNQGGVYTPYTFPTQQARYLRIHQTSGPNTYGTLSEARVNMSNLSIIQKIVNETVVNSTEVSSLCIDSDGGNNPKLRGIVNISNATLSHPMSYEDGCYSATGLFEYFCEADRSALTSVNCPGGCKDGACLEDSSQNTETPEKEQAEEAELQKSFCGSYELTSPKDALGSSQFHNYRASNAIDGNVDTHWFGDPAKPYPKWIYFDLGSRKCVNAVELNMFLWDTPTTVEIQTSNDASNWLSVSSGWVISEGGKYVRKEFPEQFARYVRVYEVSGKREYGTLSEIKVNNAPYTDTEKVELQIHVRNIFGADTPEKYYEVEGKRAYLEIDGVPVADYVSRA